jgi:hypothetical protein
LLVEDPIAVGVVLRAAVLVLNPISIFRQVGATVHFVRDSVGIPIVVASSPTQRHHGAYDGHPDGIAQPNLASYEHVPVSVMSQRNPIIQAEKHRREIRRSWRAEAKGRNRTRRQRSMYREFPKLSVAGVKCGCDDIGPNIDAHRPRKFVAERRPSRTGIGPSAEFGAKPPSEACSDRRNAQGVLADQPQRCPDRAFAHEAGTVSRRKRDR